MFEKRDCHQGRSRELVWGREVVGAEEFFEEGQIRKSFKIGPSRPSGPAADQIAPRGGPTCKP